MKKRIAILCAMMLGASMLTACGGGKEDTVTETPAADDVSEAADAGEEEETKAPDDGMTEAYEGIIDDYRDLVQNQWDYGQIYEKKYSDLALMIWTRTGSRNC